MIRQVNLAFTTSVLNLATTINTALVASAAFAHRFDGMPTDLALVATEDCDVSICYGVNQNGWVFEGRLLKNIPVPMFPIDNPSAFGPANNSRFNFNTLLVQGITASGNLLVTIQGRKSRDTL